MASANTVAFEIVLLQDVMASYASNWHKIATTSGADSIKTGDVFRERGFGEGAEELYVAAFDLSPIPGGSRILFTRCHHSTKPQSYRLGAVLQRIEASVEAVTPHVEPAGAIEAAPNQQDSGSGSTPLLTPIKRGPGRPRKEPVVAAIRSDQGVNDLLADV